MHRFSGHWVYRYSGSSKGGFRGDTRRHGGSTLHSDWLDGTQERERTIDIDGGGQENAISGVGG